MNTRSIRFRLTVWYAGLLAGLLVLFGVSTYLGLGRYLLGTLRESLAREARQIGETLLSNIAESGEAYVIDEINEHFAPEMNGRFIRITRARGGLLYESGRPRDESFDPSRLPVSGQEVIQSSFRQVLADGSEFLIYALPFTARDGSQFLIEAGAPYGHIEGILHALLLTLIVSLPMVIGVAVGGGYVLMRRALKPVDEITQTAERITSRNLGDRLPLARTGDELERLSISLNRMIERLDDAFQHIRRFSADASHELRTPLTVLRGELEAIARRPGLPTDVRETIGSALEETDRLSTIVESLLTLSRLDAGETRFERERVDLAALVGSTAEQLRLLAEDKGVSLKIEASAAVEVEGDHARLKQVIVNLLDNAIKYTPGGGSVTAKVSAANGKGLIEVSDTGLGIPSDALPHVFERFYRVDKARSRQIGGTGLGLSIVKSICAAHLGTVRAESPEGRGSRFRVELPLARNSSRAQT